MQALFFSCRNSAEEGVTILECGCEKNSHFLSKLGREYEDGAHFEKGYSLLNITMRVLNWFGYI